MPSPELSGELERRFDPIADKEPIEIRLGHLGLVDALEFDHPNPSDAPSYWKILNDVDTIDL